MMRDSASVRLTWSAGRGPSPGGSGGLPPGLRPVAAALARRQLGLILGLLALEALSGTGLDRRARLGQLLQALLTPRQLVGDRQAVGQVGLVDRLGLGQQVGDLGLQLRLDPAGVLIGQRAVPAGVGVDLGAVQGHRAHPQHTHFARQFEHLDEQLRDLLKKAPPEHRDGVVVGVLVGRDEAERHGVIGRALQLAAGEHPRGVAVHQDAQQHRRVVGGRAGAAVGLGHPAQVEAIDHLHYEARQVLLRQPLVNRRRQQETGVAINRAEVAHSRQILAACKSVHLILSCTITGC
jgi:hypothetical protein